MRLSQFEIESIKSIGHKVFGTKTKVYLFGSRVDDEKKGGDIDLLIKISDQKIIESVFNAKIKFLVQLKEKIGEQKIDVLLDYSQKMSSIYQTAYQEGVLL